MQMAFFEPYLSDKNPVMKEKHAMTINCNDFDVTINERGIPWESKYSGIEIAVRDLPPQ